MPRIAKRFWRHWPMVPQYCGNMSTFWESTTFRRNGCRIRSVLSPQNWSTKQELILGAAELPKVLRFFEHRMLRKLLWDFWYLCWNLTVYAIGAPAIRYLSASPPQFNCYCAPPSGPKGHGLSKLPVSVLYVRGPIFSQFWSALETYASMLALNFFICPGVSQTYSFPL